MISIGQMIDRITGREAKALNGIAKRAMSAQRRAMHAASSIQAAATGSPGPGWSGVRSHRDEDKANREYLESLGEVLQRSQDLDVNNPDLRGFHRSRTAQIVGPHVKFKSVPRAKEVGIDAEELLDISSQIDRIRQLHSRTGGFDSTGLGRSEGEQQQRAWTTALIHGCCLIHRVWQSDNPILPFSIELLPGVRISTPYERMGDRKLSYGIEYEDEHRSRVVAFHVRRVSKTIGDSFIPDYVWDRLPIEDCALLAMTEPAGMDRSMPLAVADVRMLRNRGEFIESSVAAARAQSKIYAATEVAPGSNPYNLAMDDTDETNSAGTMAFTQMGDVQMLYTQNGEKVNWNSAKLPGPDFRDFMDVTDERLARGLSASVSRFTRKVNSSWAGGRLEDQQDDPIVDQYRRTFCSTWQKVNVWFLESVWLTGAVELPGYSSLTAIFWAEFRAEFPGKAHINPQDEMAAREKGYMLRTTTPQQACEQDGKELRENIRQWAEAKKIVQQTEDEFKLEKGSLDFLLGTKTISTSAGETVDAPPPAEEISTKPKLKLAGDA